MPTRKIIMNFTELDLRKLGNFAEIIPNELPSQFNFFFSFLFSVHIFLSQLFWNRNRNSMRLSSHKYCNLRLII